MIEVSEGQNVVLRHARPLAPVAMAPVVGRVLAEDIASDLDMPPFDKAMMDGFAVRTQDLVQGKAELAIVEEISAGKTPTVAVGPGQCTRIMTGAPVPN